MSNQPFPILKGMSFSVTRTPVWSNQLQTSISGKDTAVAYWSYPKWRWTIPFEMLRSDTVNAELQNLAGFFNLRTGSVDTFLYTDPYDKVVSGQLIGTGDGVTALFQLARAWGGFVEPMFAPNTVTSVTVNSAVVASSLYTVSPWGSTAPGMVTFSSGAIPASSYAVAASFSYYFPCRFMDDTQTFENFMYNLWNNKSVKFQSVK